MARGRLEQQVEALAELKASGPTSDTARALEKALTNRNNYYVSKAAAVVEQLGMKPLIPDLIAAYSRFFEQDDPQCWAKTALVRALAELGHDDAAPFLRGLAHVQMEPVFGGRVDTAGALRGNCALALVGSRGLSDIDLLRCLTPVLLDADKTVRIEAARALARLGREEGALLLRLRALQGDADPEVLGAVFNSIIAIERRGGIEFVGRFLEADVETAEEAAMSLGESRASEAFEILKRQVENPGRPDLRRAFLTAVAVTRLPEATEFLLGFIQRDAPGAADARKALLDYGALSDADRLKLQSS